KRLAETELNRMETRDEAGMPRSDNSVNQVRWEARMLDADVGEAVAAFANSVHGFAKRLPAGKRARFAAALDSAIYSMQGEAAAEAEGGMHPKHRLMRYHDFFVSRIGAGDRVIDLGCGNGALAASIAAKCGAAVVGMDWSEKNLARARSLAAERGISDRLALMHGDITSAVAPG